MGCLGADAPHHLQLCRRAVFHVGHMRQVFEHLQCSPPRAVVGVKRMEDARSVCAGGIDDEMVSSGVGFGPFGQVINLAVNVYPQVL